MKDDMRIFKMLWGWFWTHRLAFLMIFLLSSIISGSYLFIQVHKLAERKETYLVWDGKLTDRERKIIRKVFHSDSIVKGIVGLTNIADAVALPEKYNLSRNHDLFLCDEQGNPKDLSDSDVEIFKGKTHHSQDALDEELASRLTSSHLTIRAVRFTDEEIRSFESNCWVEAQKQISTTNSSLIRAGVEQGVVFAIKLRNEKTCLAVLSRRTHSIVVLELNEDRVHARNVAVNQIAYFAHLKNSSGMLNWMRASVIVEDLVPTLRDLPDWISLSKIYGSELKAIVFDGSLLAEMMEARLVSGLEAKRLFCMFAKKIETSETRLAPHEVNPQKEQGGAILAAIKSAMSLFGWLFGTLMTIVNWFWASIGFMARADLPPIDVQTPKTGFRKLIWGISVFVLVSCLVWWMKPEWFCRKYCKSHYPGKHKRGNIHKGKK